jgi:hypothetical protein
LNLLDGLGHQLDHLAAQLLVGDFRTRRIKIAAHLAENILVAGFLEIRFDDVLCILGSIIARFADPSSLLRRASALKRRSASWANLFSNPFWRSSMLAAMRRLRFQFVIKCQSGTVRGGLWSDSMSLKRQPMTKSQAGGAMSGTKRSGMAGTEQLCPHAISDKHSPRHNDHHPGRTWLR